MIHDAFQEGFLEEACTRKTVVMNTNEDIMYFRGIVMVDVIWKATTGIINRRLNTAIQYHDKLHGFQIGSRTVTTNLKDKLLQHLTTMREEVLHTILLELKKAYATLDWDKCLYILIGYVMGPRMLRLLWMYRSRLQMVAKYGG